MYLMDANCINQHLYCIQFILNSSLSHEVLPKAHASELQNLLTKVQLKRMCTSNFNPAMMLSPCCIRCYTCKTPNYFRY